MHTRIRKGDPFAAFGPLHVVDGAAEGGAPKEPKATEPEKPAATEAKTDDSKATEAAELASKIEAQQKVNRDLEGKLNTLKDGLKAALGVEDKKTDPAELVAKLQEQLDQLTHTNTVNEVARRHKITDGDDIALLATAKDADALERLAARLAPPADGGKETKPGKPGTPKADPSQGRGGDGAARATSVAQVMADRRAAREKKTN